MLRPFLLTLSFVSVDLRYIRSVSRHDEAKMEIDWRGDISRTAYLGVQLSSTNSDAEVKLEDPVAPFLSYTMKLSNTGVQKQPYRMGTAVCNGNLYVSWTAVVGWRGDQPITEGRLTILSESRMQHQSTVKMSWCNEAGGVTATPDCKSVGMLCRSSEGPHTRKAEDAMDEAKRRFGGLFGFENNDPKRDDHMYLVEFHANGRRVITAKTVHVAAAIGGWEYGNFDVMADQEQYFISIKTTAGGHEGQTSFGLSRRSWTFVGRPRWSCGPGHIMANRVAYNPDLALWSQFCRADGTFSCADPKTAIEGECGVGEGSFFSTYPGSADIAQVKGTPQRNNGGAKGNGGPMNLIPLGEDGWLGVGLGPAGRGLPVTVGLVKLPGKVEDYSRTKYPWMWLDLKHTSQDEEVEGSKIGYVNLQRFGADEEDRFLVGYATGVRHGVVTGTYYTQEVTSSGCLLGTPKEAPAGWGQDTVWTRLSTGCVASPYVWPDGASKPGEYGKGDESRSMRISIFCPAGQPESCEDGDEVDECANGDHECDPKAACTNFRNRAGGRHNYRCVCPAEFEDVDGYGKHCRKEQFASGVRFIRKADQVAQGNAPWMWDVKNLELYGDTACSDRIEVDDGEPIGSAYHNGDDYFSPAAALGWKNTRGLFGGRLDATAGDSIWLGIQWKERTVVVRCAKLIQDGSLATHIRVEGLVRGAWTGLILASTHRGQNQIAIPATPAPSTTPTPKPTTPPTPKPTTAPTQKPFTAPTTKPTPSPPPPPPSPPPRINCFNRGTSFAYAASHGKGDWRIVKMEGLRAGDFVLAVDAKTGIPFADRIVTNLHVLDHSEHDMLEIRHTHGIATVTPDHVLLVDGKYIPARDARPESSMLASVLQHGDFRKSVRTDVIVLSIKPTSGRIINPLTHSGLILLASDVGKNDSMALVTTTILESSGNSMLAMIQWPGMGKLASRLFPDEFQESTFVHDTLLVLGFASSRTSYWLGLGVFVMADAVVGASFIFWYSGAVMAVCMYVVFKPRRLGILGQNGPF